MFHFRIRRVLKHRQLAETEAFRELDFAMFFHYTGRFLYRMFVPVVLLMNGYSLSWVFAYLIGYSLLTVLFSVLAFRTLGRHNAVFFNFVAVAAEICLVFLLLPEKISGLIFVLIVLFESLYYSFYYLSLYSLTCHYSSRENTSNNLGNLQIVVSLANIAAPLLGALLLTFSKPWFIAVALVFLLVSVLFVLQVSHTDINRCDLPRVRLRDIGQELFSYAIASGIEFVIFMLWGIYVYLADFSLFYIGLIPAADAIVNILFVYVLKKRLARQSVRSRMKILAVLGLMAASLFRFFLP